MLPQIVGPGTFTPSPLAPTAAERTSQGAQPTVGETAAAALRPETAARVDPPRVLPAPLPLPAERRRDGVMPPPDPAAPAGPPPAFEETLLERARAAAFAPADLIARPMPPASRTEAPAPEVAVRRPAGAEQAAPVTGAESTRQTDADAALRGRMETEVAEVRRMAGPEPDRALDLTR
jgi:hypothetical protein